MLVVLPPSETKSTGGNGPALDLATLSFPELGPVRARLTDALVALSSRPALARSALKLTLNQDSEIERNRALLGSGTVPALRRYTGVLYDALDVASLTRVQRQKAQRRLLIGSALFGLLGADDAIPAYRLSGATVLPGLGGLRPLWRPALAPVLAGLDEFVLDLRSGSYAALAPIPGAITVEVVTQRTDGTRTLITHDNKSHKGRLARLLVTTRADPGDLRSLLRVLRAAGRRIERSGPTQLTLVV